MMKSFLKYMLLYLSLPAMAQSKVPDGVAHCENPAFDREVQRYLRFDVPPIDVETADRFKDAVILDTREYEEFAVSHIPDAIHVGFKKFDQKKIEQLERSTPVIVYCSIGYRSEKIGRKLRRLGFEKVYNLYGSIFEWANRDKPLVDPNGQLTERIHTYNRSWSRWVDNPALEKTW